MSNSAVTAILARCLLDASFLEQMAAGVRDGLCDDLLDERTRQEVERLDFARLRSFAGFITKVQHNFLWESFPYTSKLLRHYRAEIMVFAEYRGQHQALRARPEVSREEKIVVFLDFLQKWLRSERGAAWTGLREVMAHERAEWEIRCSMKAATAPDPTDTTPLSDLGSAKVRDLRRLVPSVRGALRCVRFDFDPLAIISSLARGEFRPESLLSRPQVRLYWGDPRSASLRVVEVDGFSAALLSQVDGRRSVETILRRARAELGTRSPGLRQLWPLFEVVAQYGLLVFKQRGV